MDDDHIDAYSPGAVVNFESSRGSIVPAKILGPSELGADSRSHIWHNVAPWYSGGMGGGMRKGRGGRIRGGGVHGGG